MKKVGYIVSEYPARSHTYIRREIEAIEQHQIPVDSFSIRKCDQSELLTDEDQVMFDKTWSVFPVNPLRMLLSHLKCLFTNPLGYMKCLLLSFSLNRWGLRQWIYALFYFIESIYLAEEIKRRNIDCLHIHFSNSGAKVGIVAAEFLGIPWMISLHGSIDFEYPGILWLREITLKAEIIRCVSYYGASQLMREHSIDKYDDIFVAYCGLPDSFIDTIPATSTAPPALTDSKLEQTIKIVSVGRLSSEKGQVLLLELASHLKDRNIKFSISIVGAGSDEQILIQHCKRLKMEEYVEFVGSVSETEALDWIAKSDIFVCPSFMEGLPQVIMEAMLLNTPVIAPYIAGIPELVKHQKNGLLYPAGNTKVLADMVCELIDNPDNTMKYVDAARKTIEEEFLISKTITPLVVRLNELCNNNTQIK